MVGHRASRQDGGEVQAAGLRQPGKFLTNRLLIVSLAVASCGGALAEAIAHASGHQIDFDIYRMGAGDVLGPNLYSARLSRVLMGGSRGMHFTYPPFAAIAFWPFSDVGVRAGQVIWSVASVLALALLTALSIRMVRPGWSSRRIWCLTALAMFPVFMLEPNSLNLVYGQVNIFIVLLIVLDLSVDLRWGSRRLPRGILVGIAAAIKLTPLIFVPFLFLTRQVREGVTALASFLVCTLAAFLIAPHSSWLYWSTEIFDSKRSGNLLYISNQDLHSALQRLIGAPPPGAVYALLLTVFAAGGLAIAAWAYRSSSPMAGILACAATGLIVSPVSWAHHYVWAVPAIAWLALGADRPVGGPLWALGTAVLFWAAPIWFVPDPQSGYGGALTIVEGNSYLIAAVAFLVLVAAMLWLRRRSRDRLGLVSGGERLSEPESKLREQPTAS